MTDGGWHLQVRSLKPVLEEKPTRSIVFSWSSVAGGKRDNE